MFPVQEGGHGPVFGLVEGPAMSAVLIQRTVSLTFIDDEESIRSKYEDEPSVSATVLPLRDSAWPLGAGDCDPSIANLRSNIISPYSSSGSSNGQYTSFPSASSETSVTSESSCYSTECERGWSRNELRLVYPHTLSSSAGKLYNVPSFCQIPGIRVCSACEGA